MHGFARWLVVRRTHTRAERVLRQLGPHLTVRPSDHVLELGMGGGGLVALLQERFRPARLVGTDLDAASVAATERSLRARWGSLPPSIELRPADALALPFDDGSFDQVYAMMMFHHVEASHGDFVERPRALREVRRVLVPGGRLVYSEITRREETLAALVELGFVVEYRRNSWRSDLTVLRRGTEAAPGRTPA